jgi:hypothetical protein
MKNYCRYLAVISLLSFWTSVSLAGAGILSGDDAQAADPDALLAEVAVFKSIREGMTISVMQCSFDSACDASSNTKELKQLINALDQRIDGLSQRQQDDGDAAGLEDVLIAYVDERDGLSRVLKNVSSSSSAVVEHIDEADLFGDEESSEPASAETEATEATEATEQLDDMFSDEDEEI